LKYIFKEGECDVDVHNQLTKSVGCQVEKVQKDQSTARPPWKKRNRGVHQL